jgi:hypothetical protein
MIKGAAINILRVVEKKLFIASFTTSMISSDVLFGKNVYLTNTMMMIIAQISPRRTFITSENNIVHPTRSSRPSMGKNFFTN